MSNNKTRRELLKEKAEKETRQIALLQHCTKIDQGLKSMPENAGNRAIWELVQNARDLSEDCTIRIELTKDKFIFAHKGEPFTFSTFSSLIQQVSSLEKQLRITHGNVAPKVGQYGTGFITTHEFSKMIRVFGSMEANLEDDPEKLYVNLHDKEGNEGFVIDREYESIIEFLDKMDDQIMQATNLLEEETSVTPREWTELHYVLSPSSFIKAKNALTQARSLMPLVMALNPKINNVTIVDEGVSIEYLRGDEKEMNEGGELVVKVLVSVSDSEDVDIYCLVNEDRSQIIIIPPSQLPAASQTPSLFLFYPLLETEDFGTNFVFHAAHFKACERRNGIVLPSKNENAKNDYTNNVAIYDEMTNRLLRFLSNVENQEFWLADHVDMARVYFSCEGGNEYLDEYFKKLKTKWVETFVELPLLKTEDGRIVSVSSGELKLFHPSMYENLDVEKQRTYLPVIIEYAKMVHAIPAEQPLEWSKTVAEWNAGHDEYFITFEDICAKVKENSDTLLQFVRLMKDAGMEELFAENAIIPNRNGVLCKGKDLSNGFKITDDLFRIAKPLLGDKSSKILHPDYKDLLTTCGEYTREALRDDISNNLSSIKRITIDAEIEFEDSLKDALLEYCSYYPTPTPNNFRSRVMDVVFRIYKRDDYAIHVIPSVLEKEVDLYETPFNYLIENTLLHISKKDPSWVLNEEKGLLYKFLCEYCNMNEKLWTEKLPKYKVFPNQNHVLCLAGDLHSNINVDDQLAGFYTTFVGGDLKDGWICDDYKDLITFEIDTDEIIAGKIKATLSEGNYSDRNILDLIDLTEEEPEPGQKNRWRELFKEIYGMRQGIRYELGSDDERKAINRMLKRKNEALLVKLADVSEAENPDLVLLKLDEAIANCEDEAYKKMLGDYVESHIEEFLNEELGCLGVHVKNEQGGQDFILSKEGYKDYFIEVKSRWVDKQPAIMSSTQYNNAVDNHDRFALISAQMWNFGVERAESNERVKKDVFAPLLRVSDKIGTIDPTLLKRVKDSFSYDASKLSAVGTYEVHVPQVLLMQSFDDLISILKTHFI